MLQYRAQDAKTKIIGIIFDNHPNAMYFWDDSGMTSPADIVGKTVAVPETDGHKVMWPAFAAMIGVDPDSVEFINIESTAKVSALASHNADVVFELLTGYPNFASAIRTAASATSSGGLRLQLLRPHSYIASDDTIANDPEMLKTFLDVTYRAWEYVLNNPEEAVEILSSTTPSTRTTCWRRWRSSTNSSRRRTTRTTASAISTWTRCSRRTTW